MRPSLLSSVLSLILCPLLIAQETAPAPPSPVPGGAASQPRIPAGTALSEPTAVAAGPLPEQLLIPQNRIVQLITLDPVSTATETVGSTIRLAVGRDFTLGGVTMLRYGTVVNGTVTRVSRGVAGKKRAQLEIRVDSIPLGKDLSLKLDEHWTEPWREKIRKAGLWVLGGPIVVLASPFLIALALEDQKDKPTGEDIVYRACTVRPFFVASDILISVPNLDPASAGTVVPLQDLCPKTRRTRCNGLELRPSPSAQCSSRGPAPYQPKPASAP